MGTFIKIFAALSFAAAVFIGAAALVDHFWGLDERHGLIFKGWRCLRDKIHYLLHRDEIELDVIAQEIEDDLADFRDSMEDEDIRKAVDKEESIEIMIDDPEDVF